MKLDLIFIMMDESPQQLLYVCPGCGRQNHQDCTYELDTLACGGCGVNLDGTEAAIEILSDRKRDAATARPPVAI